MKQNCFFVTHKENNFIIKNNEIVSLYTPILGHCAINLYRWLINENDNQSNFNGILQNIDTILSGNNISIDDFEKSIHLLEAFELVETYYLDKENKYYFLLKSGLSFNDFIARPKFKHLLLKNIGKEQYERLEFLFQCSKIPVEAINISKNFGQVFDDKDINEIANFNFVNLHQNIAKSIGCPIILSDEAKKIIENYFVNYNLSTSEIENCVFKSFIIDKNKYIVDINLLNAELNALISTYRSVNISQQLRINRNKALFFGTLSLQETNDIYNTYNSLNCEQYLNAIIRRPLNATERNLLRKFKDNYKLSDNIINLIIDFSYFKTNGQFNSKYIEKVANSILGLNLNSLQEIISYLKFEDNVAKRTYQSMKAYESDGDNEDKTKIARTSEWI